MNKIYIIRINTSIQCHCFLHLLKFLNFKNYGGDEVSVKRANTG